MAFGRHSKGRERGVMEGKISFLELFETSHWPWKRRRIEREHLVDSSHNKFA